MTIALFRARLIIYSGRAAVVDEFEWSFERVADERRVNGIFTTVVSHDATVEITTPDLAKIATRKYLMPSGEERTALRLSFHAEPWGIDAGAVATLAFAGARGFSIATEGDVAKYKQPTLLGEIDAGEADQAAPVGAYGPRRQTKEDKVTPVVEAIKAHRAAVIPPEVARDPGDIRFWPTSKLVYRIADIEQAMREIKESRRSEDGGESLAARLWQTELGKVRAELATRPPPPAATDRAQPSIDGAGADLGADLDNAIQYIVDGRGAVAIAILRVVRSRLSSKGSVP